MHLPLASVSLLHVTLQLFNLYGIGKLAVVLYEVMPPCRTTSLLLL